MQRKKKPTAFLIVALYPITFLEPHTSALLHCAVAQQFLPTVSVHFLRNVVEDTGGALRLSPCRPIHIVLYSSSCWSDHHVFVASFPSVGSIYDNALRMFVSTSEFQSLRHSQVAV
jgi:hypothetical protein